MSALAKADIEASPPDVRFTPKSGHRRARFSCPLCAKSGHSAVLFDHLVGAGKKRWRRGKTKRLGDLEIDRQLVFGRRLYRQIGWLLAFEDAIDIAGRPSVLVEVIRPI